MDTIDTLLLLCGVDIPGSAEDGGAHPCSDPAERARLLLYKAQVLRLAHQAASGEASVVCCGEAVQLLEGLWEQADLAPEASRYLTDDLACAALWHGICLHDVGGSPSQHFQRALALWSRLLAQGAGEGAPETTSFRDVAKTQQHLSLLASLFRLLDQSANQVLVHDLIVTLNAHLQDTDALTLTARSHAAAGHSIGLLG